jgi:drug/metabolite transporter (DMT)-like permease
MPERKKAYLQLHLSVFLWGFTAILGKMIVLKEVPLVWYRMLFTCIMLLFFPSVWRNLKTVSRKNMWRLALIGCLVCLHWVCFYGSIKASNVSVALSCLATTSFMTSLIEPLFSRTKVKRNELFLGFIIIPAIYLIFYFTKLYVSGIILGLFAALFAATFTTLNKTMVDRQDPMSITFIELSSGLVFLTILMPFYFKIFPAVTMVPVFNDWIYLFVLASLCTVLPFIMSLKALKHLTAFSSVLTVNLEPVYGIILAIFFFQENKALDPRFYIGTGIILGAVFLHPFLQKRLSKPEPIAE